VDGDEKQPHRNVLLVLPARGGDLEVTLQRSGEALANGTVQLSPEQGAHLYHGAYVGAARGDNRSKVESLLYPIAQTDNKGVARFRNLPPGTYTVFAVAGDAAAVRTVREGFWGDNKGENAICRGVAVRTGQTRKFRLAVYEQATTVRLQLLQPGGKPLANRSVPVDWGRGLAMGTSSSQALDADGAADKVFSGPGLCGVRFRYRDTPVSWTPLREAPYYEASAVVGVSPLLRRAQATVMTALRRDPGSVVVQLLDLRDRPARGVILSDATFGDPALAGSTDDRGEVRFEGVLGWEHDLEAHLPGLALPDLSAPGGPPADRALVGRLALFKEKVQARDGAETRVVIRPRPVGYVRGVIRPPKGRTGADYTIQWDPSARVPAFEIAYDPKTGDFVMGPLAPGKTTVWVTGRTPEGAWPVCATKEVEVRADRVVHVEFTPRDPTNDRTGGPEQVLLGMGGLYLLGPNRPPLGGQVYLPDGKTPAAGARLALFLPTLWPPVGHGLADALGQIHLRGGWYSAQPPEKERPGSPTEPVLVAYLPGAHGAAVVPVKADRDRALKVVLPPALHVRGKVTVGGKGARGWDNQLHVLAAYEGKGKLDDLLSLRVSAEADGSFELAGLTPGTYRVQAAMDGIWLSPAVRLTVTADGVPREPLTLNIGEPGAAGVLKLVNRHGEPARGIEATVVRPDGPLAAELWPAHFTSDGAGVLNLPPLEAGTHRLHFKGFAKVHSLVIPPLSETRGRPTERRVVVE
jgi:hypothetical protein